MYFPESQITPNQYTNGGEFKIQSTGQDYKGYYFITSTGQRYTGRNQNDNPVLELTILTSNTINTNPNLPEVTTLTDYTYNNIIYHIFNPELKN